MRLLTPSQRRSRLPPGRNPTNTSTRLLLSVATGNQESIQATASLDAHSWRFLSRRAVATNKSRLLFSPLPRPNRWARLSDTALDQIRLNFEFLLRKDADLCFERPIAWQINFDTM